MQTKLLSLLIVFSLIDVSYAMDESSIDSSISRSVEHSKLLVRTNLGEDKEITYQQKAFGDIEATNQYEELALFQAPVVHPYDVTGENEANWRIHCGVPTYLFFARIKDVDIDSQVPSLRRILPSLDRVDNTGTLSLVDMDIFLTVQNNPWKDEKLLLRPHYWIFGNQPNIAKTHLYRDRSIQAKIMSQNGIRLNKQDETGIVDDSIAVHVMDRSYKKVISSADNLEILGIPEHRSIYFWSYVKDKGNSILGGSNRSALTMHVMLIDEDFNKLASQSNQIHSIEYLLNSLKESVELFKKD